MANVCPPDRETVMQALFALVQGLPGFTTIERRMTMPGQGPSSIDPVLQPALMMWEQHEHDEHAEHGLPIRKWYVWFVIAFVNNDRTLAGATLLNPLIDQVRAALAPDDLAQNVLRLKSPQYPGGIVAFAFVEGTTLKHTGDTDAQGQGGCVIPVTLLIP